MELRVLIYAPHGSDAGVMRGVLACHHIEGVVCASEQALLAGLVEQAATVTLTEETLPLQMADSRLLEWLNTQPSWSDFPFVVLATRREGQRAEKDFRSLHSLGNLVLLERPLNPETLVSAA